MDQAKDFVLPLVKHLLGQAAKNEMKDRMERATPGIVAKMTMQGFSPAHITGKVVIRDAMFRLWKSVVGSGTVADLCRDAQDQAVVPAVMGAVNTSPSLGEVVDATREAILEQTFGG